MVQENRFARMGGTTNCNYHHYFHPPLKIWEAGHVSAPTTLTQPNHPPSCSPFAVLRTRNDGTGRHTAVAGFSKRLKVRFERCNQNPTLRAGTSSVCPPPPLRTLYTRTVYAVIKNSTMPKSADERCGGSRTERRPARTVGAPILRPTPTPPTGSGIGRSRHPSEGSLFTLAWIFTSIKYLTLLYIYFSEISKIVTRYSNIRKSNIHQNVV